MKVKNFIKISIKVLNVLLNNKLMQKYGKTFKFLILTRHGQRIDNSNLRQNQKFPVNDPELTQTGREQAYKIGNKIKNYFKQSFDININKGNIELISSPYARTIQTSIEIIKSYNIEDTIKIDNRFAESTYDWVVSNLPLTFLSLYSEPQNNQFITLFHELEESNFKFKNNLTTKHLPINYETEEDVILRVKGGIDEILKSYLNNDLMQELKIIHIVSHAGPLGQLRSELNRSQADEILSYDYCDSDIYIINDNLQIEFNRRLSIQNNINNS